MSDLVIKFKEIKIIDTAEGQYSDERVFLVSTRKLEKFKEEEDFAYGYVKHLIEMALKGVRSTTTSRKYSFGDIPEWYESLRPDVDCADPVYEFEYEVYV